LTQPYEPPSTASQPKPTGEAIAVIPGRLAIWGISGVTFCLGAASLFGGWALLRMPDALSGVVGVTYYYYALRPIAMAVGFFGLSWKSFRYVDAITHNAMSSDDVRLTHGSLWNWMAVMLASFVAMVAYHSLGG